VGVLDKGVSLDTQNSGDIFNIDGFCTKSLLIKGGTNHSPVTTPKPHQKKLSKFKPKLSETH